MRRRTARIVIFALTLLASPQAWGQPSPGTGRLLTKADWVRFEVLFGRLAAFSNRIGQTHCVVGDEQANGWQESLNACSEDAQWASVRYEQTTTSQQIQIDHRAGGETTLVRIPRGESTVPRLQFHQLPQGRLTLEIGAGPAVQRYEAATLWHLLIAEPDVCRQQLIPCLELLRPHWRLLETSQQIEAELLAAVKTVQPPNAERLKRLVDDLSQAQFQRRQAADRELRTLGVAILPFLQRLKPTELDSEQKLRIRRIQDSFQCQTGDTAGRVAAWLIDDRAVWGTLLAHRDTSLQRR